MRNFLTVKTGEIPNQSEVYEAFKRYAATFRIDTEALLKELRLYSRYYCSFALANETDLQLKEVFLDIKELKVEVCYPLLLSLYHDYSEEKLAKEDFLKMLRCIESYVFRRAICDVPTNSMNKTFAVFAKDLDGKNSLEAFYANFLLLPSYRRFPGDVEFKQRLQTRDLYSLRAKMYFFRKLENSERKKEPVIVSNYSIEHVMPQNEDVSDAWKKELGIKWKEVWEKHLHTLGNLTLTGYNPELSDRSFKEKRDMENGLGQSALKLNAGFSQLEKWDEEEICKRAVRLSEESLLIWSAPTISKDAMEAFKPKQEKAQYTLQHYAKGGNSNVPVIYELLQKKILAIDPCISEDFLKHYIAFKAESNFVHIKPQTKRLRLALNIPFGELDDPKKLATDITMSGRWGNVEFRLEHEDDVSYAINLITQSFNWQMSFS